MDGGRAFHHRPDHPPVPRGPRREHGNLEEDPRVRGGIDNLGRARLDGSGGFGRVGAVAEEHHRNIVGPKRRDRAGHRAEGERKKHRIGRQSGQARDAGLDRQFANDLLAGFLKPGPDGAQNGWIVMNQQNRVGHGLT